MVKALADSGLVRYEPYAGVRLTAAGEKLAALVLRRHRLIELFLVKVMGMSWTEVHDDAENLEHAVSDRLIQRMDEMLGHPEVDPHGDPIPGPEGTLRPPAYESLLTCPLHAPVTVSRVADQDREFLEFIERHELKPGEVVQVEERDQAGDTVRLRGRDDKAITIGARAASKVLVRAGKAILALMLLSATASAQTPTPAARTVEPFTIMDNSFLVEEAFNQEAGIFQNIFGIVKTDNSWGGSFTQEWPVRSQTHQFSYTIPFSGLEGHSGVGDILLNYRYQVWTEEAGRPAFSPRISVILPTGSELKGFGEGTPGLQINLPFSKQREDLYFHWNAGLTAYTGVSAKRFPSQTLVPVKDVSLVTPHLAGSLIWRTKPMLNLMMESVLAWPEALIAPATTGRLRSLTLSPGARGGWNVGDQQIIVGVALPITWSGGDSEAGIFGYFSYELPFRR
jgi:DtxR family Mn-dependent transcriptional regulator